MVNSDRQKKQANSFIEAHLENLIEADINGSHLKNSDNHDSKNRKRANSDEGGTFIEVKDAMETNAWFDTVNDF